MTNKPKDNDDSLVDEIEGVIKDNALFYLGIVDIDDEAIEQIIQAVRSHDKQDGWISAEDLADELFKFGDEPNSPCQRIQFMGGDYATGEKDQGGMCKHAVVSFFELRLPSPPDGGKK